MIKWQYIAEVCEVRDGQRCKDCIYYGKKCESIKRAYHVAKPMEMLELRFRKDLKNGN